MTEISRKNVLAALGVSGVGVLVGCATNLQSARNPLAAPIGKTSLSLDMGVRHQRVSFPLWETSTKIPMRPSINRHAAMVGSGHTCPDTGCPIGPAGERATRVYADYSGNAYGYRNSNASSLYDNNGILVMQSSMAAQPNDTFPVQCASASGDSYIYTLPSPVTIPLDTWISYLGSQFIISSASHSATIQGVNGITYTLTEDNSGNMVIHANDGSPDTVIPAAYATIGTASSKRQLYAAGYACNAAGFVLGATWATIAIGAIGAIIGAGGRGAAHIVSAALTIGAGAYAAASAVCQKIAW